MVTLFFSNNANVLLMFQQYSEHEIFIFFTFYKVNNLLVVEDNWLQWWVMKTADNCCFVM